MTLEVKKFQRSCFRLFAMCNSSSKFQLLYQRNSSVFDEKVYGSFGFDSMQLQYKENVVRFGGYNSKRQQLLGQMNANEILFHKGHPQLLQRPSQSFDIVMVKCRDTYESFMGETFYFFTDFCFLILLSSSAKKSYFLNISY